MRKLLLTVALAALLVPPVLAQRPPSRRGDFTAFLLTNRSVQDELGLADEQRGALNKAAEERRAAFKKASAGKDAEGFQKAFEAYDKALAKVKEGLTPAQSKRLHQITLQVSGASAFQQEDVQKALALTDEQKVQIEELGDRLHTEAAALRKEAGRDPKKVESARKKILEMRKGATARITKSLGAEQKAAWKKLSGEPFQLKVPPPGPSLPRPKKDE
jgi:tetratricopeptide (TPR) repeat protein